MTLSDNSQTDYKARELKSVHVDAVGCYLKLVIHKNHVNKYNLYNQVIIIHLLHNFFTNASITDERLSW